MGISQPPNRKQQRDLRIIHGIVKFVGTPPALGDFPNSICGATLRAIPQEAIVVGKTGGLSNCLVYLRKMSWQAEGGMGPRVMLDQIDCRYVPHVVGVMVGEPLVIPVGGCDAAQCAFADFGESAGEFAGFSS